MTGRWQEGEGVRLFGLALTANGLSDCRLSSGPNATDGTPAPSAVEVPGDLHSHPSRRESIAVRIERDLVALTVLRHEADDRSSRVHIRRATTKAVPAQGMARDSAETEGLRSRRTAKPGPEGMRP
jgi:hypothetical protein